MELEYVSPKRRIMVTCVVGEIHGISDNTSHQWESLWWRDLKKVRGGLNDSKWFENAFSWKVGNGDKCRFWKDSWLEEQSLQQKFPRLFSVSVQKDSLICEVWSSSGNTWSWDLTWKPQLFEWERTLLTNLLSSISSLQGNVDSETHGVGTVIKKGSSLLAQHMISWRARDM